MAQRGLQHRRKPRKRNAYTRARAKRGRPKTAAPTNGWLIGELSRLTGFSVRTLRHYVTSGILRPLEFRGTATRYPRRELVRLLRMVQLKTEGKLRVTEIKRKLDALSDPELEAWLAAQPLAPELAAALGVAAPPLPPAAQSVLGVSAGLRGAAVETWQRVHLLPGLELLVSADASPAVRGIAQKIFNEYVGTPGS